MTRRRPPPKPHPAHALCGCFEGTPLAAFARPGLDVLETNHKNCVYRGASVACGVPLDRARQVEEDQSDRWDYVFTLRSGGRHRRQVGAADSIEALAVEVHHAAAEEVPKMIAKKRWAEQLLSSTCPTVVVKAWVWVASPPRGDIFLLRQSPAARQLDEAGITFPITALPLP